MKILFTSSWFPSREHETLGNFVERHAIASSIFNDVYVLYVRSAVQKEDFVSEVKEENGLKKVIVYYKKVENKLMSVLKFVRFNTGMKLGLKLLKEEFGLAPEDIDVCHHNIHFEAGIIPLYLKKHYKTPYIISENWTGYLPSNRWEYTGIIRKYLTKKIGSQCDIQVPVSIDLKNSLTELGIAKGRVEIIPNVVAVDQFELKPKPDISTEAKFLHVSTLDESQKNISGILKTFKKFIQIRPHSSLTIIGDGDHTLARKLIDQLGLKKKVKLIGRLPGKEIATKLNEHHIFLLFSNYENLPCVIVEALATGTPVLASTAGGTPEHLNKDLGELVEPKDEEGLLAKMIYMVDNYNNYDLTILREYALDNFSYEVVGKQFNEIYRTLK